MKLLFNLFTNKLNLVKVLKNFPQFTRFGLMCGLFSFLFKFTRYLIRKFKISISLDKEVFIAAAMSSLSLFLADARDQNLLKVFVLPRAAEAFYSILVEKGIISPIKYGTQIMNMSVLFVISYNFLFEPHNMPPSFMKTLYTYSNRTQGEAYLLDAMRESVVLNAKDFYPNPKFGNLTYKY